MTDVSRPEGETPSAAVDQQATVESDKKLTLGELKAAFVCTALVFSLILSILQRMIYGYWMSFFSLAASTAILSSPFLISIRDPNPDEDALWETKEWKFGVPLGATAGFLYGLFFGGPIANAFFGVFIGAAIVGLAQRYEAPLKSRLVVFAWISGGFVVLHLIGFLTVPHIAVEGSVNEETPVTIAKMPDQAIQDSPNTPVPRPDRATGAVINKQGDVLFYTDYDDVGRFSNGIAVVRKNTNCGLIDSTGKLVVPCDYKRMGNYREGMCWAQKYDTEKYGYIKSDGTLAIPFTFESAGDFSEGKAVVKKGGYFGYIDRQGSIVIDAQYYLGNDFHNQRATVVEETVSGGHRSGIIDSKGSIVLKPTSDYVFLSYSEGLFQVLQPGGRVSYVDLDGNKAVGTRIFGFYSNVGFRCGLAAIRPSDSGFDNIPSDMSRFEAAKRILHAKRVGFVNKMGSVAIDYQYDQTHGFSDDRATVQKDGKWGVIDTTGKWIVEPKYSDAKRYSEGLAAVCIDSKWGFIDVSGNVVIPFQYDREKSELGKFDEGEFHDGMVAIKLN